MSSKLSLDKVFFSCIFDDNFGLSEDESFNEDGDDICSCLEKSRIDYNAVFLMSNEVTPNFWQMCFYFGAKL